MLTGKHNRYSDNFAQTKGLRVAARQRCLTGLALSVTCGDTSPKGRGLGKKMKFAWTAKGSHFGGAGIA